MRQAYDYWQDQPGSYFGCRARERARKAPRERVPQLFRSATGQTPPRRAAAVSSPSERVSHMLLRQRRRRWRFPLRYRKRRSPVNFRASRQTALYTIPVPPFDDDFRIIRAEDALPPPALAPLDGVPVCIGSRAVNVCAVADPGVAGLDSQDQSGSVRARAMAHSMLLETPVSAARRPSSCARANGRDSIQYRAPSVRTVCLSTVIKSQPPLDGIPICFRFTATVDSGLGVLLASVNPIPLPDFRRIPRSMTCVLLEAQNVTFARVPHMPY